MESLGDMGKVEALIKRDMTVIVPLIDGRAMW